MNAFITGSHAYGTPNEKSNIDMVVFCEREELNTLKEFASNLPSQPEDECTASERGIDEFHGHFLMGRLDLIVCTDITDYTIWEAGTKALKAIRPVTREQAVEVFQKLRKDYITVTTKGGLDCIKQEAPRLANRIKRDGTLQTIPPG